MRVGLHDLAQSAATDGQIPAWDDANGLWVPVDPAAGGITGLTSADSSVVITDNLDGTLDLSAPGTGGGGDPFPLDPATLDPTYGEGFDGAGFPAGLVRAGSYVSGDETYQDGGGSWLKTAVRSTGSYYYWAHSPSGDFALVMSAALLSGSSLMFGIIVTDNTGAGVAGGWYNGSPNGPITAQLNTSTTYDGSHFSAPPASTGPTGGLIASGGERVWYKLVRVGNTWKTALSMNGFVWSPYTSTLTVTFTPTRIGFGSFFGSVTTVADGLAIDFFDKQ